MKISLATFIVGPMSRFTCLLEVHIYIKKAYFELLTIDFKKNI